MFYLLQCLLRQTGILPGMDTGLIHSQVKKAFHEGVDFPAEVGTPIKAAAGGVVVYADRHPEYGNMIEIDHGDDLVSRYAHASKRLARLGQVVLQGQKIAEVGSTGRSTGAHLHFEIRHKDKSLNPSRFLKKPG